MNVSETKIKSLRAKAGISQEELSALTRLSLRTIQRIENGETIPRGDSLQRIAKALNVEVEALTVDPTPETDPIALKEDQRLVILLMLSPLAYFIFPLLGILLPAIIWLIHKDTVKDISEVGGTVLKLQLIWLVLFAGFFLYIMTGKLLHTGLPDGPKPILVIALLYISNACIVVGHVMIWLKYRRPAKSMG